MVIAPCTTFPFCISGAGCFAARGLMELQVKMRSRNTERSNERGVQIAEA